MSKILAIAGANLRMFIRYPSNLFFVFIFPLLLVLVLGVSFGGTFEPRLGVVAPDTPVASEIVDELAAIDGIVVERFETRAAAIEAVERASLSAAVLIDDGFDEVVATGQTAEIEYLAAPGFAEDLRLTVQGALVSPSNRLRATGFVADELNLDRVTAAAVVDQAESFVAPIAVTTEYSSSGPESLSASGQFGLGAVQEVALFVFLTSLTAATQLILTRQLGVASRMMATPTPIRSIVLGETLGRYLVALTQALFIIVAAALLFGVRWGNPAAAAILGILMGSVLDNEAQAGGVGVMLGLVLAALGGAMVPLEVFSDSMQRVAHLTPHAWLIEAFEELIARDGSLVDILPQVAVLGGAAAVLLLLSTVLLRRSLTT